MQHANETAGGDLREAGRHAKQAAMFTLKAIRDAVDTAIRKLDDDEQAVPADPADTVPPARPGDTTVAEDDRVV